MNARTMRRPTPSEHTPYHGNYISKVPDGNIVEILETQITETLALVLEFGETRAGHRYAPGKWSVRELVGHVMDTERVFAYRALAFARADPERLPGFDENDYVRAARFDERTLASLVEEFELVRRASARTFAGLPKEAWDRRGVANEVEISVRALAYLIAGHERHHREILRERYR